MSEDPAPQFLFSEEELKECETYLPALVDGPGDGERFSGAIIEKQQRIVDAILTDFVADESQRAIADKYKVSRNTVAGIVRRAEASGKIEPFKQRLSRKLGRAMEANLELYIEKLEAGAIQAAQLPVGFGIHSDKKAALDGDPTEVIEHRHTLKVEDWRKSFQEAQKKLQGEIQNPEPGVIDVDSQEVT